MRMTRLRLAAGSVAVVALLFAAYFAVGAAQSPPEVPASDTQTTELTTLLRREERAIFDSLVSGNMQGFPTIFYNDPSVPVSGGFTAAISRVGSTAVDQVMTGLASGPRGTGNGLLSAEVALTMERQQQLAAYAQAKKKAAVEGRQPQAADMPAGVDLPASPLNAEDWVDVPFDVYDAVIQGDHATAKLAYGSRQQSEMIDVFTFTNVHNQWYISGVKTIPNPNLSTQQSTTTSSNSQ